MANNNDERCRNFGLQEEGQGGLLLDFGVRRTVFGKWKVEAFPPSNSEKRVIFAEEIWQAVKHRTGVFTNFCLGI